MIFLVFAGVMNFAAYWFSDKFALRMAGAREIQERDDPHLFAMVREVAELSRMPMPRVYIIQNDSPNAFATGRNPQHAVVAVTTGIQRLLTDRELRGVLGHEMGHVKNRDILTSSIVATVAGAISMIAQMLMWSSLLGGRDRDQNPFVTLAVILIAPIADSLSPIRRTMMSSELPAGAGTTILTGWVGQAWARAASGDSASGAASASEST